MDKLETMTLEEIKLLRNQQDLETYYQILDNLKTNRITKQVIAELVGESLLNIMNEIEYQETSARSNNIFPGELILLHPHIVEAHSRDFKTCDFSGAIIYPKSLYVNYRPLLENMITNEAYVLKRTIKVEPGYAYRLPNTILELEELEMNMQLKTPDSEIDFSHLNQRLGGQLVLQKLRRNKYENRNC